MNPLFNTRKNFRTMRCKFIKSNKKQCGANAMKNSDFCFSHNPKTKRAKQLAVIKGGKSPKRNYNPLPPVKLTDNKSVANLLARVINEVRQGKIDRRVANCIGYLSGHLIKALEISDLEKRVAEMERIISEKETARWR